MFPFLCAIAGLVVGSFLNVVIFRLESGEGFVTGRSKCRSCKAVIRWYDNVPIFSYLSLRGRCRFCGSRISLQYPLVEASTAVLFYCVARYLYQPGHLSSVFESTLAFGLIPVLVVVFVYDLRRMEIPVSVLAFGILWTFFSLFFLWMFATPVEPFLSSRLFSGILGGAIAFSLLYALVFFSKETWMGAGDAWLSLLLGMVSGWETLLHALTIAFGSGALVGIALLLMKKRALGSRIPFGPFLSASVIFLLFFGKMMERQSGLEYLLWI